MTGDPPVPRRSHREAAQFVITVVECYATAEIVWYTLHGQHLHEAVLERVAPVAERIRYRLQIIDTLRMIRRLPER